MAVLTRKPGEVIPSWEFIYFYAFARVGALAAEARRDGRMGTRPGRVARTDKITNLLDRDKKGAYGRTFHKSGP